MKVQDHERDYIVWQNRSFRFYLAARVLYQQHMLVSPAAFCAQQAVETLMKATLLYWDRSFDPLEAGHGLAKMQRMIRNKAKGASAFECPQYFYHEKRYQEVTRYPKGCKGVGVPGTFLLDLDRTYAELVQLVPFQFNSELGHAVGGKDEGRQTILAADNVSYDELKAFVGPRARRRA